MSIGDTLKQVLIRKKTKGVQLPAGDLEKIWLLAQFARKTQDIFSGKVVGQMRFAGVNRLETVELKKSVCSVRDLDRIMEKYDRGRDGSTVDQALWESFIDQAVSPVDQALLFQEARLLGFFDDSAGWKMPDYGSIAEIVRPLTRQDIHQEKFHDVFRDSVFLSARDVVQLAFGKAPERTQFPDMDAPEDSHDKYNKEKLPDSEFDAIDDVLKNAASMLAQFEEGKALACAEAE